MSLLIDLQPQKAAKLRQAHGYLAETKATVTIAACGIKARTGTPISSKYMLLVKSHSNAAVSLDISHFFICKDGTVFIIAFLIFQQSILKLENELPVT